MIVTSENMSSLLTLSAKLTDLGDPDVLSDRIRCSKNILAIFSLQSKAVVFATDFCIGTESDKLGEINGSPFLFLCAVHVVI